MLSLLYDMVITPLIYLIEVAFAVALHLVRRPGLAIVFVSVVVNLICMPLYRMADAQQQAERDRQGAMERWVTHIKGHFRGDEQYMMLSAYYREQGYSPLYALNGSVSLLLQIPIFIAAYTCLSGLSALEGQSFLAIADLSAPDALLRLGATTLNVLPIVMTLLNCVSTAIYTKGFALRDKLQAYGLALVFLVLLYRSPSGLVLYWTCNQVFSLVKNLVIRHVAVARPKRGASRGPQGDTKPSTATFLLAAGIVTAVTGLLVPSALIGSSPAEFMNMTRATAAGVALSKALTYTDPMDNVVQTLCVMGGFFAFWGGIYYFLAKGRSRSLIELVYLCLALVVLVDYLAFSPGYGIISPMLVFDDAPEFPLRDQLLNLAALAACCALAYVVWRRQLALLKPALAILLVAVVGLSATNVYTIARVVREEAASVSEESSGLFDGEGGIAPQINLSRTGRNVVVLFLDRGINEFVPYLLDQRSDLAERLDGFCWYRNTISHGRVTVFGSPGLYGGYEYVPSAMNARDDELMVDKHNESLKVLPSIFRDAGYQVALFDPPLVNYTYGTPDYTTFDDCEGFELYHVEGAYTQEYKDGYLALNEEARERNFVMYGLLKALPSALQPILYDSGNYFSTDKNHPMNGEFINSYTVLERLEEMTDTEAEGSSFVFFHNYTTHAPEQLQLPNYVPAAFLDNRAFADLTTLTIGGRTMSMELPEYVAHYDVNMALWLQLGRWFDYLREQGVYDNTRIIIVADHGYPLHQFADLEFLDGENVQMYNPLIMVKDFDAHGFATSDEFMTCADTALTALAGIVDEPVNPFTGNVLVTEKGPDVEQLVTSSWHHNALTHTGTDLDTSDGRWIVVHDDVFDLDDWHYVE